MFVSICFRLEQTVWTSIPYCQLDGFLDCRWVLSLLDVKFLLWYSDHLNEACFFSIAGFWMSMLQRRSSYLAKFAEAFPSKLDRRSTFLSQLNTCKEYRRKALRSRVIFFCVRVLPLVQACLGCLSAFECRCALKWVLRHFSFYQPQTNWNTWHVVQQCVSSVLELIAKSLDAWRTRQYDYYQKVLNGIL